MTSKVTSKAVLSGLLLAIVLIVWVASLAPAAESPAKLSIQVFENLEGYHTQASELGTRLGQALVDKLAKVEINDQVPLRSNETVRILEEMTEGRQVVVTTLTAYAGASGLNYPSIVFADDAIKFSDLTWKLDEEAALAGAKKKGSTHCLMGVCTALVTKPNRDTAAGKRSLMSVTASINLRLHDLSTGETVWMNTYQKVVTHSDPRLAFIQAMDDIAPTIAADLQAHLLRQDENR